MAVRTRLSSAQSLIALCTSSELGTCQRTKTESTLTIQDFWLSIKSKKMQKAQKAQNRANKKTQRLTVGWPLAFWGVKLLTACRCFFCFVFSYIIPLLLRNFSYKRVLSVRYEIILLSAKMQYKRISGVLEYSAKNNPPRLGGRLFYHFAFIGFFQ